VVVHIGLSSCSSIFTLRAALTERVDRISTLCIITTADPTDLQRNTMITIVLLLAGERVKYCILFEYNK
jgi:hypothetical protein